MGLRGQGSLRGARRVRARRLAVLCLAVFLTGALVASAHATLEPVFDPLKQNQDVGPASCGVIQATGNQGCADTEVTPVAKDGTPDGWSRVAGAKFPAAGDGTMDSGATLDVKRDADGNTIVPADVDFFALVVKDETDAYAGGSECKDPIPADKTKAGEITDYVRSCERVPVIYHYTQPDPDHQGTWAPEYRGDSQGYVGGLAYTARGLIVAAGGTGLSKADAEQFGAQIYTPENGPGAYPYREDCNPAPGALNPGPTGCTIDLDAREAGSGRVWIKGQDGAQSWCEAYTTASGSCADPFSGSLPQIDDGGGNSTPMRGFTALDCSPRTTDGLICVGGGYQQLWEWRKDDFDHGIDAQTAIHEISGSSASGASPLQFRIRAIEFSPGIELVRAINTNDPANVTRVAAVSAGCCGVDSTPPTPVVLTKGSKGWGASSSSHLASPDSYYSLHINLGTDDGYGVLPTAVVSGGPAPGPDDPPELSSDPPGSETKIGSIGGLSPPLAASTPNSVSSARIVDAQQGQTSFTNWGVGALARTQQGIAWNGRTSLQAPTIADCPPYPFLQGLNQDIGWAINETHCKPASQDEIVGSEKARSLVALPTFSLNAFQLIYTGIDRTVDTGTGWAIGDRGAIMSLGTPAAGAEDSSQKQLPPVLGRRTQTPAPDTSSYDSFRGSSSVRAGVVPALATQPFEKLATPQMVPGGIPDATRQGGCLSCPGQVEDKVPPQEVPDAIVMSRDGRKGWALGTWEAPDQFGHPAFFHYDGGDWTRCDPSGVPDPSGGPVLVPADSACAELADFANARDDSADGGRQAQRHGAITAAARVPLENDSDPSNDDEFEIVAAGFDAQLHPILLRYRYGRWSLDKAGSEQLAAPLQNGKLFHDISGTAIAPGAPSGLVFTAPTDGWMIFPSTKLNGGGPRGVLGAVFHYDGKRWINCTTTANAQACGDENGELQSLTSDGTGPFQLAAAGPRVYVSGSRHLSATDQFGADISRASQTQTTPVIIYRDGNGTWTDHAGGLDPKFDAASTGGVVGNNDTGEVSALMVSRAADGNYAGWAMGEFGPPSARGSEEAVGGVPLVDSLTGVAAGTAGVIPPEGGTSTMLHLSPGGTWARWSANDATDDYLLGLERQSTLYPASTESGPPVSQFVPLEGAADSASTLLVPALDTSSVGSTSRQVPPLVLRPSAQGSSRWRALPMPFAIENLHGGSGIPQQALLGAIAAVGSDGQGGAWLATVGGHKGGNSAYNQLNGGMPVAFYHYTDRVRKPIFADVPHPIRQQITAATGGPDGSFWVATDTGVIYRRDRLTGWDRMPIGGWDPGRVVASPSPIEAIAIGADGSGLAVGTGGRIADLSSRGVRLDDAAGTVCDLTKTQAPCGTAQTLRAAAVAPDGSALVGGDRRTLLWRPRGGDFRAIQPPPTGGNVTFTAISMPAAGEAWVTTDDGRIFAASIGADGTAVWRTELHNQAPDVNARDEIGGTPVRAQLKFRAIALDSSRRGYAVGTKGLVFERTGDAGRPWKRVDTGFTDNYTSVAVDEDGHGALIGGEWGRVLSLVDGHFEVAHQADRWNPYTSASTVGDINSAVNSHGAVDNSNSEVVGVALAAGDKPGQIEAWAASQAHEFDNPDSTGARATSSPTMILRYSSDPADPLLDAGSAAKALPDAPQPRAGEITFAAFGKTDCQLLDRHGDPCPSVRGTSMANDRVLDGLVEAIKGGASNTGKPAFALFTGDVGDQAGPGGAHPGGTSSTGTGLSGVLPDLIHRRFVDQIAEPLGVAGVPLYGALGGQDHECATAGQGTGQGNALPDSMTAECMGTKSLAGTAIGWRQSFGGMPAPWGVGSPASGGGFADCPLATAGAGSVQSSDTEVPDPSTGSSVTLPTGGARTHYAFDVTDGGCGQGKTLARVVVVDTSLGSLAAAAANDQPHEAQTQLAWLKSALCIEGDKASAGQACTRPPSEQAVVVSEDPSYSYGPSTNDIERDATTFEALMQQYRVNAVVSGRLGWNGLYWALAPGVHDPCPGGGYPNPSDVPDLGHIHPCSSQVGGADGANGAVDSAETLAAGISAGTNPPTDRCSGEGANQTGTVPYVVASSAGGKFAGDGPAQNTSAAGDPRADQGYWHGYTIVRLDKTGDPRCTIVETRPIFEWIGIDGGQHQTHVLRPGQKLDPIGYGREPDGYDTPVQYDAINSFAITHRYDLLYADPDHPWVPKSDPKDPACDLPHNYCPITDSRVGTVNPVTGEVNAGDGSQPRVYAIVELSIGEHAATYPLAFEPRPSFHQPPAPPAVQLPPDQAPPPAPAPPAPPPPFQPPTLATPPPLTPLPAQTPPVPPVPPAPPTGGPTQLDLFTSPPVLSVSPTVSLFPPSAPVINVAPPTPARPVEKAKKVAVQSSGSDSDAKQGGSAIQEMGGDLADKPSSTQGAAMTRHDPNAFTAIAHRDQASAWARDLQWGGGLTLMALVAAFGWITVRPTPKRREPEVPSPAFARNRRL
jgi:hypothetical protein